MGSSHSAKNEKENKTNAGNKQEIVIVNISTHNSCMKKCLKM